MRTFIHMLKKIITKGTKEMKVELLNLAKKTVNFSMRKKTFFENYLKYKTTIFFYAIK